MFFLITKLLYANSTSTVELINHTPYDLILDHEYHHKMCEWGPPHKIPSQESSRITICFEDSFFASNLDAYGRLEYRINDTELPRIVLHAKVDVKRTDIDSTADRVVIARLSNIDANLDTKPSLNTENTTLAHVEHTSLTRLEIHAKEPEDIPDETQDPIQTESDELAAEEP